MSRTNTAKPYSYKSTYYIFYSEFTANLQYFRNRMCISLIYRSFLYQNVERKDFASLSTFNRLNVGYARLVRPLIMMGMVMYNPTAHSEQAPQLQSVNYTSSTKLTLLVLLFPCLYYCSSIFDDVSGGSALDSPPTSHRLDGGVKHGCLSPTNY